ncbi:YfiR family protein [Marinobacteraceae bacterium S3BR75-40.1]
MGKRTAAFQAIMLGLLLAFAGGLIAQSRPVPAEQAYRIKALFLYNFANFVEWPETAFDTPDTPLRMCLYGEAPFSDYLEPFENTRIRDRRLTIIKTSDRNEIHSGCHILFVGTNKLDQVETLLANVNPLFVLSVGSTEGFTDKGGIINILRTRDQQEFVINLSKAIENGLLINSDLLALARVINQ